MKTTAVIVHWGSVAPTVQLAEQLGKIPAVTEVVVVPNDRQERPAQLGGNVSWLVPPGNLGFGGGFRFGYERSLGADCYVLLNSDVSLCENTVNECLALLSKPDVGVVGPTLVNAGGLHTGSDRLTTAMSVPKKRRVPTTGADEVSWLTGAVMFLKAACLREVPMTAKYFLVYEDVDYCYRARNAGWQVVVSPAQAWHSGGATIPKVGYLYYSARNQVWFARWHGNVGQVALAVAWLTLIALPRSAVSEAVRSRSHQRCQMIWRGVRDGLSAVPEADEPLPDEPRPRLWGTWN